MNDYDTGIKIVYWVSLLVKSTIQSQKIQIMIYKIFRFLISGFNYREVLPRHQG